MKLRHKSKQRSQLFEVRGKLLYIKNTPLQSHEIRKSLGDGKNGVVYLAFNLILGRLEALKIWRSRDSRDRRNKLAQGLREAQKLAKVSPEYAISIYGAQEISGVLIATMEYIEGATLFDYMQKASPEESLHLADLYLRAIIETTTDETRHGDAHAKNVMVYQDKSDPHEPKIRLKLLDFGTSMYSGKDASENRHWDIVKRTIVELTKKHKHAAFAHEGLTRDWDYGEELAKKGRSLREADGSIELSDKHLAQLWASSLRGYLNDIYELSMYEAKSAAKKHPPPESMEA
jgi:serine/threonine protein kinase